MFRTQYGAMAADVANIRSRLKVTWHFVGAQTRSKLFQKYCAEGVTRSCVACQARLMSARSGGYILLQLLFDLVRPGAQVDRVLNGPTNDVWLDLWLAYLTGRGVDYRLSAPAQEIHFANGLIDGITVLENGVAHKVTADHYIAALPLERIVGLISKPIRLADDSLDWETPGHQRQKGYRVLDSGRDRGGGPGPAQGSSQRRWHRWSR